MSKTLSLFTIIIIKHGAHPHVRFAPFSMPLESVVSTLLVLGTHHRLRVRLKDHCCRLGIHSWFETSSESIALAFNRIHRPEYIIIEYKIHHESGLHLCQDLKESNPATRIILAHAAWTVPKGVSLQFEHVDVQTCMQYSAKRLARDVQTLY